MSKWEYADKYPHSVQDIPAQEHWVILKSTTQDDGYGGTSPIVEYEGVYLTEEKFTNALEHLFQSDRHRYIGIHVKDVYKSVTKVEVVKHGTAQ